MCPAMENDLATWILEQREKGACLDQYEIQKKALYLYDLIHPIIDGSVVVPIVSPRSTLDESPASYEAQPPASYLNDSPASNQVEYRCDKPRQLFSASNGWFLNFCHRKRFASRRITTSGRNLPGDAKDRATKFFTEVMFNIKLRTTIFFGQIGKIGNSWFRVREIGVAWIRACVYTFMYVCTFILNFIIE